ncbi:Signal transduction histidine-protein kinase BarA [Gammaproteobacteria bacterium MOLA455]|nr:Signal transduction histidine-protein kinase BarA [Gammaproteobacteria bacterium MOLA455]
MAAKQQFSSIHSRLLITSLLPLTLLCIVLASYMISSQRAVLLANLHNTGSIAAQQISSNAEFAVYSNNRKMLRDLGESVLDIPAVNGLLFFNASQNTSVSIGELDPDMIVSPQKYEFAKPVYRDHNWYFYSRVILTPPALEDYDEGQQPAPDVLGWVVVSLTDEILEEQYREGIFAIVLVSTLGLLMAAWLSMRIGRSISHPVELLTGVVESMEAGSLNNLAVEAGPVEVRKLASGINQLATTVRQSNVRMQSEVARATAQLQITLIELEEAMEAQDQFLARMSHELRTPLTAVIGFSKLLSIETDAQKRDENLRIINMSSNMLLTMIDDILEFSKARAGGFALEKVSFYIESWITDLMSIQRQRAEEKGLTLSYTIDKTVPQALVGDPVRFTQVISNLLSNAIKFTDAGSINVAIRCLSNRDGKVTLYCSVADTGKGIEEAKIPTLFDPFSQEDTSINRRFGGAGLGLSICKNLVQVMGGRIQVRSKVGQGSTFSFTCQLSLSTAPNAEALIGASRDIVPAENVLAGMTILVAEDNAFNQKLIVGLLKGYGASCLTANNGQEAIEIASELHVDAILMDIHMPIVDGVIASETIIQQSGESPPIIALTADVTMVEQERIIKAGAAMLLLKPVNESELINSLNQVITNSKDSAVPKGAGLLSTVVPVEELKQALYQSLDKLDEQLRNNENGSLREIVHDLMGLSGLYGMTELREMVLAFRADYSSLNAEKNLLRVKQIRQHINDFLAS